MANEDPRPSSEERYRTHEAYVTAADALKAQRLLLDEDVRAAFTGPLNLEMVATLPYGTLYVNRDARCGAVAANVPNLSNRPRVQ